MGYLNNVTGYRDDLLANRAIVKHGNYALLTPDGLVKNIIRHHPFDAEAGCFFRRLSGHLTSEWRQPAGLWRRGD